MIELQNCIQLKRPHSDQLAYFLPILTHLVICQIGMSPDLVMNN